MAFHDRILGSIQFPIAYMQYRVMVAIKWKSFTFQLYRAEILKAKLQKQRVYTYNEVFVKKYPK